MTIDLNEIVRLARAVRAESQDAEWFEAMAAYRGATEPHVVLALIARIGELEIGASIASEHMPYGRGRDELLALLNKGVVLP
jgi:hypothetical protein